MKTQILSTALVLTLAAPAFANDQLAQSLGVEPGAYTTAQLVDLDRAYEENDETRVNFILSGGSNLSTAEIERRGRELAIERAVEEDDFTQVQNLRQRPAAQPGSVVSSRGVAELPGHLQQVVVRLDINAADFTLAELSSLERSLEEGDYSAVNGIIGRVAG
jgi:hypothetical protein